MVIVNVLLVLQITISSLSLYRGVQCPMLYCTVSHILCCTFPTFDARFFFLLWRSFLKFIKNWFLKQISVSTGTGRHVYCRLMLFCQQFLLKFLCYFRVTLFKVDDGWVMSYKQCLTYNQSCINFILVTQCPSNIYRTKMKTLRQM